jgi:3-isopropylmalate/(R)-2-methylmalate dehydratase large subunit
MGLTTIEKILARTSGKDVVRPGDIAVCRPDIVIHLDLPMTIEGAWYRPKKIFDTERVVVVFDHAIPSPTIKDASAMVEGRRFAREFGLKHFFDVGQHGIAGWRRARLGASSWCAPIRTRARAAGSTARGAAPALRTRCRR